MISLDQLLCSLDPSHTLDVAAARADEAFNSFRIPGAVIRTFPEFEELLTRFCLELQKAILCLGPTYEGDHDALWGECRLILNKNEGPSGYKAAYDRARTGVDGGLNRVLKDLARGLAEEYGAREVIARARSYLNGLSPEERIAVAREYIDRYRSLLPAESVEGSGVRLVDNFAEVLALHPRLLRRLRAAAWYR